MGFEEMLRRWTLSELSEGIIVVGEKNGCLMLELQWAERDKYQRMRRSWRMTSNG